MTIEENYPLRHLNTFGIEASTRYYAAITAADELTALIGNPLFKEMPKLILGGGSNLLLTRDFDGITIHMLIKGIEKTGEDTDHVYLKAGAGTVWHDFVLYCIENGYAGAENLSLIPGTVGAAPMQNIGAYGVELKEIFYQLEALEISNLLVHTFSKAQCDFGYRESFFKKAGRNRFIITSVTFALKKQPSLNISYGAISQELENMGISKPRIADVSLAVCKIRNSKLPNPAEIGNAGSFFKNPEVQQAEFDTLKEKHPAIVGYPTLTGMKIAAGWLIEQCGWKGKTRDKVGVHARQALVMVNYGGGKGSEVLALAKDVQQSVRDTFGVQLEMEVNIL